MHGSFTNENGLRVQKTINGVATKYTLHGKNVVHMTSGTDELHFFYDAQNRPAVVVYNGMAYAYVKSLQGDIVAILDESGNAVVSYGYDAWGAPLWCTGELAETLGKVQPFRYRGYVFDWETGLYYLRSRYYNPRWGRFVNADECFDNGAGLLAANLFAYCANSAVAFKDTNGRGLVLACVIAFGVIGAVLGGCYGAAKSEEELGYVDAGWVASGAIIGGAAGAVIGWGVGTVASSVMASQIIGQLGPPTYASWQQAEASLRQTMNCFLDQAERTLWTPYGNRIVDAWNTCERVIGEAKYGYTCLTRFIELQIEKDVWLLENGVVQAVEWHFYASQVTGQGGASQPLIDALLEAGFTVFFH